MCNYWNGFDRLSWGERAKMLFSQAELLRDVQVKETIDRCFSQQFSEKCENCPLRQIGCSDRLDIEVWKRLKRLTDNEKANKLINEFDNCFSGGLPNRCSKCAYNYSLGCGCKERMLREAWNIWKSEMQKKGKNYD